MTSRIDKFDLNLAPSQRKRGSGSPKKRFDGETSSTPCESEEKKRQKIEPPKDSSQTNLESVDKTDEDDTVDPLQESIWKGCFEISSFKYGRIAAHLSTIACLRVFLEASKLLPILHFEKLPKAVAWPKKFTDSPPTARNIALYFFPETQRDELRYNDLIDEISSREFVLIASIGQAELLLFSSLELPQNNWRISGKCYLWGLLRERKKPISKPPLIVNLSSDEEDPERRSHKLLNESSRPPTFSVSNGQYGTSQPIRPAGNLRIGDERKPFSLQTNRFGEERKPFSLQTNRFGDERNPYSLQTNWFRDERNPVSLQTNRFGDERNPLSLQTNRFGDERNPFSLQTNRFRDERNPVSLQTNWFRDERNPFSLQTNRFGDERNPFSLQTRRFGDERNLFSFQTNRFGDERNPFSLQTNRLGDERNPFSLQTNRFGDERNPFSLQTNRFGDERNPFSFQTNRFGDERNPFSLQTNRFGDVRNPFSLQTRGLGDEKNPFSLQTNRFRPSAFRSYSKSNGANTPLQRVDLGNNSRAMQLINMRLHGDTTISERERLLNNPTGTNLVLCPLEPEGISPPPGNENALEAKSSVDAA